MNRIYTTISLLLLAGSLSAQLPKQPYVPPTEVDSKWPYISAGIGILSFSGDVGSQIILPTYSNFCLGYGVDVEKRLGNAFGVGVNFMTGKVAKEERSTQRNLNFSSDIMSAGVNLKFHLDNGFIFKRDLKFAPYITAGFNYLTFKTMGDLKDQYGEPYYYWSDGTIRSMDEKSPMANSAIRLPRDYVYETDLHALNLDSVNYPQTSFSIPIGGGITFKIIPAVYLNIGASYHITMTDWIDNVSSKSLGTRAGDAANDKFLFSYITLSFHPGARLSFHKRDETAYESVDFKKMEISDSDHDGVKDIEDACPETPDGVKVDARGCPIDDDGDGVPNYLDKELNTKRGAVVDESGVTMTDEQMLKLNADTIASHRDVPENVNEPDYTTWVARPMLGKEPGSNTTYNNSTNTNNSIPPANTEITPPVNSQVTQPVSSLPVQTSPASQHIPAELRNADINGDGKISTKEISNVIDRFFDGDKSFNVELIDHLIDYFFEQ